MGRPDGPTGHAMARLCVAAIGEWRHALARDLADDARAAREAGELARAVKLERLARSIRAVSLDPRHPVIP